MISKKARRSSLFLPCNPSSPRRGYEQSRSNVHSSAATCCPFALDRPQDDSLPGTYKLVAERRASLLADDARSIISFQTMAAACSHRHLVIDASLPDKSLPVKRPDGERGWRTRCGWKKGDGGIEK